MTILARAVLAVTFIYPFLFTAESVAQDSTYVLLGGFEEGWQESWVERKISAEPTRYEVVEADKDSILQIESETSALMLWRMMNVGKFDRGTLSWEWKLDSVLSGDIPERSKMGDDYAARVFVVFEPHAVSWKTRALCYVWAAKEPIGASYDNPYANSVRMIVVESGKENKGEWQTVERNIVSDYQEAFGGKPEMISAIALMVDTDNSNQEAFTWFDDVSLEVSFPDPEAADSHRQRPMIRY